MAFPRDASSIRHHGSDHIYTIPPAVVRYSSVTFLRLALPLAISSCGSSVRGVEESAGTKADSARADGDAKEGVEVLSNQPRTPERKENGNSMVGAE